MSSTRTILEEERKQRLAADPLSYNASVKTTFEMEYDPSCESRAGATNWKKTLCVSAFIILTIAASTALQVRLFITKKLCDKDDSQPTALLSFVLLTLCAGMCDVLLQASMPSSSVLPKTRRALNLVPIALFLLATSAIDDTKPAGETCATFTYAADTGGCKHLDVSTMNDFGRSDAGLQISLHRTYSSIPRFETSTALILGRPLLRMNLPECCFNRRDGECSCCKSR